MSRKPNAPRSIDAVSRSLAAAAACLPMALLPRLAAAQASPFLAGANALQQNILTWLTPIAIILVMVLGAMAMANRYVPFEEHDQARQRGAQWDAEEKCWFIDSVLDPAPFHRWLDTSPQSSDEPYRIASDQAFLVSARTRCWKCNAGARVVCVYCESGYIDGEPYDQFTVSNITAVDAGLARQLEALPDFRFGQARVAGGRYLVNHCRRCGAQQADYYLHCEPSGVFFSFKNAPAGALEITPVAGRVRLAGDEGFEP
jgi:Domain of unknown function (DUF5710)